MTNLNFRRCLILCSLTILCLQIGCTTNKYREPISKFQAASAVVSADARKSFTESNRMNRNFQIKKLARQGKFITKSQLNPVQFFDEKDLQARLDALDRLNEYVDLLVSIANSDAPQNISKSATDLTGALGNLTNTVAGLSGESNNKFKTKTINAFGVTGVVVSEVLKSFAQYKIKKGLEAAISKGALPIDDLIDAIADDLNVINLRFVTNFESQRDELYNDLYNCELNKVVKDPTFTACKADATPFSQQKLDNYRDQISVFEDTLETLNAANPMSALTKMKKAHVKIVMLAKSDSPASFTDAVAAIEDFAAAAKRLGTAVEKLKNS